MTNKSIFILGGSGFVGAETVRAALARGWQVRALARSAESAERLRALGAVPVLGAADEPAPWIAQARGCAVLVDLVQPKLPERVGRADIDAASAERQAITRALIAALASLPPDERPLFVNVSGTDDLTPDGAGRIDERSPLRASPLGFARIGVPVRRLLEGSGLAATFVYLGTVYGPGKSFAASVFPRLARGRLALPGHAQNRFPLVHVADAAAAIVHLASLERARLSGRSWLVVDETGGAPLLDFFSEAARGLGVAPPRRLPAWLLSLLAGRTVVETLTRDLAASPSALLESGFRFSYPTPREGLPPTLAALGYATPAAAPAAARKSATAWLLPAITAALVFAVNALHFPLSVPYLRELAGGRDILDMRPGVSAHDVLELLNALGPVGRARYLTMLWTIDVVLPALFTLLLFSWLRAGRWPRWRWLALAPGATDYLENIAVSTLLVAGSEPSSVWVSIAGALTIVKFASYSTVLLLAATGLVLGRSSARQR